MTKLTRLVAVCLRCGRALVVGAGGKMTCPEHGAQVRYSYAVKGKDE